MSAAPLAGLGIANRQIASVHRSPVQLSDCSLGCLAGHVHEPEPLGSAGPLVHDHRCLLDVPISAEEVGDVLFTVVNVARKLGVDAEVALRDACTKFSRRFEAMEVAAAAAGTSLEELETDDMERLWHDAKQGEPAPGADE